MKYVIALALFAAPVYTARCPLCSWTKECKSMGDVAFEIAKHMLKEHRDQ